ncbi:nitroreductase family protein [Clostridium cellulovorans]|uniref:Nitroreductase n=1 Tax=Clostridium cellulovorans (strain ATCC 35296 / DSM 3052 / OCM 3 / 743B) TaxID=573061 RepID=D9SUR3_CLOC7|nr:nitroreductase family protein [Clostridium cellulovorans]ADL50968.1 nitroreductase [Clostridium cellulovorans 743B]
MDIIIENILTRRSTRKFKVDQIRDEDLSTILEAAKHAPSGGNSQCWHFTVIQNQEILKKLNYLVREAFAKVVVDENTYKSIRTGKAAAQNENYCFYYNAPTLIIVSNEINYGNAMADSACAIENMLLAANALSLGSCYINQIRWFYEDEAMRKVLTEIGIPENHQVCGSVALGYNDGLIPATKKIKEGTVTFIR